MTATTTTAEPRSADVLEATRAIVPALRERAAATAGERRVPMANIDLLRQAGSLKVLQSPRNGGLGLGVRDHLDVISLLARGCGSTAWVAGVVHAHSWMLSHFPAEGRTTCTAPIPTRWSPP